MSEDKKENFSCWVVPLVVFGIIGAGCLFGGYLPQQLWNEHSLNATCVEYGWIQERTCSNMNGVRIACYAVTISMKFNDWCGVNNEGPTFNTRELAQKYITHTMNLPQTFTCYYDPTDTCNPSRTHYNTAITLWASVGLLSASLISAIFIVGIQIHKRRNKYTRI